jgi:hypothetical protein
MDDVHVASSELLQRISSQFEVEGFACVRLGVVEAAECVDGLVVVELLPLDGARELRAADHRDEEDQGETER